MAASASRNSAFCRRSSEPNGPTCSWYEADADRRRHVQPRRRPARSRRRRSETASSAIDRRSASADRRRRRRVGAGQDDDELVAAVARRHRAGRDARCAMSCPTSRSVRLPARWPQVSLTCLNSSRSRNSTDTVRAVALGARDLLGHAAIAGSDRCTGPVRSSRRASSRARMASSAFWIDDEM